MDPCWLLIPPIEIVLANYSLVTSNSWVFQAKKNCKKSTTARSISCGHGLPTGQEEEDLDAAVQAQGFRPQVTRAIHLQAQVQVDLIDDEQVEPARFVSGMSLVENNVVYSGVDQVFYIDSRKMRGKMARHSGVLKPLGSPFFHPLFEPVFDDQGVMGKGSPNLRPTIMSENIPGCHRKSQRCQTVCQRKCMREENVRPYHICQNTIVTGCHRTYQRKCHVKENIRYNQILRQRKYQPYSDIVSEKTLDVFRYCVRKCRISYLQIWQRRCQTECHEPRF